MFYQKFLFVFNIWGDYSITSLWQMNIIGDRGILDWWSPSNPTSLLQSAIRYQCNIIPSLFHSHLKANSANRWS